MKESPLSLCVLVLMLILATSTIARSEGLLPSHDNANYCPPRYLTGEDLILEDAWVAMGDVPYDPHGFPELERKAAAEVHNWDGPSSPSAIVNLLIELADRGLGRSENPPSAICDYNLSTFKSLLWLATKIVWKKAELEPIDPHSPLAFADVSIKRFWETGFGKGLYGLPRDEKLAGCWRKSNRSRGKTCMAMRPDIFVDLDRSIAQFELR